MLFWAILVENFRVFASSLFSKILSNWGYDFAIKFSEQKCNIKKLKNDSNKIITTVDKEYHLKEVKDFLEFFKKYSEYEKDGYRMIEKIDPIFRIPFFSFVNSPIVQNEIIFPDFTKYSDIFDLYDLWALKIRCDELDKNITGSINNEICNRDMQKYDDPCDKIPGRNNYLTDRKKAYEFVNKSKKEYEFERYRGNPKYTKYNLRLKKLDTSDTKYINKILDLYNYSNKASDGYDPSYLLKSTEEEIRCALNNKWLWIIEEVGSNELVAASIIITDPKSKSCFNNNKEQIFNSIKASNPEVKTHDDYAILDSLIINPIIQNSIKKYRGLGLMRMSLMINSEIARKNKKNFIFATVSETNTDYMTAFENMAYKRLENVSTKYDVKDGKGHVDHYSRSIMRLEL